MTSYALTHEDTTTASSGTTTNGIMTATNQELTGNCDTQTTTTTTSPMSMNSAAVLSSKYVDASPSSQDFLQRTVHAQQQQQQQQSGDENDFDCDSLSDGREKADTTPENIKKIDDVIERRQQQRYYKDGNYKSCNNESECRSSLENEPSIRAGVINVVDSMPGDIIRNEKVTSQINDMSSSISAFNNNNNKNNSQDDVSSTSEVAGKQALAFTIDHFNDQDCDAETKAARYKMMMERFQNRHRRGASMSKIESDNNSTIASAVASPPATARNNRSANQTRIDNSTANHNSSDVNDLTETTGKVKLRLRDRSTSRVRDASKRHSWSPRTSTQELQQQSQAATPLATTPKTVQKQMPPIGTQSANSRKKPNRISPMQIPKGSTTLVANRTQFTPRSTAMQLALQTVDFICPEPPLGDFKHMDDEEDNVSETGTYTLDGDNYTEEQKDLMNIDKSLRMHKQNRPKNLKLIADDSAALTKSTKIPMQVTTTRANNILEVSYYHDTEDLEVKTSINDLIMDSHQSAEAYLEKVKSRVLRSMTATNKSQVGIDSEMKKSQVNNNMKMCKESDTSLADDDEKDVGCFTSVTTSGVLAKQCALDMRPKSNRRSSLSTTQIDSSEYVSNETKLNSSNSNNATVGFTDHQKAEYRLNVFTNHKNNQRFAATRNMIQSPPETPNKISSDAAVLKTAQTKNDWIQEWARNARARSLATDNHHQNIKNNEQDLMTRSYTCSDTGDDSLVDVTSLPANKQNSVKLNKTFAERYRHVGDFDFASDPSLATSYLNNRNEVLCKPPKSPSKIPSPMHSLGRARSASHTRPPLSNILPPENDEVYLQKTAAAITNLQQSLSRKNSLKSPSHSNSPRAHSSHTHANAIYSPDENSPQHSLGSSVGYQRSPIHRRNYSNESYNRTAMHQLMTSSINEQQLQLLTSGEYLAKQMRMRKNSFDGSNAENSPVRKGGRYATTAVPVEENTDESPESPLRRSNSFSAKVVGKTRAARPQYQNIYTPPAARHNYTLANEQGMTQNARLNNYIKKSASSNNFGQVYSDYDENLQYYINDEDDMLAVEDDFCFSGDGEHNDQQNNYYTEERNVVPSRAMEEHIQSAPLTNTRYNKALLMRIERSKMKVAGNSAPPSASAGGKKQTLVGGGVIACPNTPELPRRNVRSAPKGGSATSRQSVPRDVSLSRLAKQVPNSLASAKKQLLLTAADVPTGVNTTRSQSSVRVQPKYMDISKYKSAQSNNFLRKNDSKSTLKATSSDAMKRSPSSSSVALSRSDVTRASNRSSKSIGPTMNMNGTSLSAVRSTSGMRRDASVNKQKEAEMAMWKRRSTYDPMRAAAEDRRKKEEAKRQARLSSEGPCESTTTSNSTNASQGQCSLNDQWIIGEADYNEDE